MVRLFAVALVVAVGVVGLPSAARAQMGEKGPFIESVFPPGAQRGATVEATVGGQNLGRIDSLRISGKGVVGSVVKTVDAKTVEVKLTVAPDAELGPRELRVMGSAGVSNRFLFTVGQLPEIKEEEPNNDKAGAQKLQSLPVAVDGRFQEGGDVDFFRFPAKAGQTLVIKADGRSLQPFIGDAVPGWSDVVLTLYDGDGRRLAWADDFRLHPDPVLFFQVPKDGEYMVSVRDVIYRGRSDFMYRLTVGALPYITDVYPLGARRGTTAKVELAGVNLPQKFLDLALPAEGPARRTVQVTAGGFASNALPFAMGDLPEVEEKEPNDTAAKAMRVETPVTINGRIQRPGDQDFFVFSAKAEQKMVLEVTARRLDSPLDSLLTLFNAKGEQVAENDDTVDPSEGLATHHADSRIVYTFPADGDYTVRLRDIQGKGGKEYAYRLAIAPVQPDYYLNISPDNPQLGAGDTALLTVTAVRKDGFQGEIKLAAKDLPKGFSASEAVIAEGSNAAYMTISSPPDASKEFYAPAVLGTATVGGQAVTRQARPVEELQQAFFYSHTVPTQAMFLSVGNPARLALSVKLPGDKKVLELPPGGKAVVTITAKRHAPAPAEEQTERKGAKPKPAPKDAGRIDIALAPSAPLPPEASKADPKRSSSPQVPAAFQIDAASMAPDQDQVQIKITAGKTAKPGVVHYLFLSGTMKISATDKFTRFAPAIPVRVLGSESPEPGAK